MINNDSTMTSKQFDLIKETGLICSQNTFWIFMIMESIIFNSKNKDDIKSQATNISKEWCKILGKYYDEKDIRILKNNIGDFFGTYVLYLEHMITHNNNVCEKLLSQWKYMVDEIAKGFSAINPYWNESEWRGIITNQINILQKEIQSNVSGVYSTLNQSYDIYNRVSDDIADYFATGLIKQFSI